MVSVTFNTNYNVLICTYQVNSIAQVLRVGGQLRLFLSTVHCLLTHLQSLSLRVKW